MFQIEREKDSEKKKMKIWIKIAFVCIALSIPFFCFISSRIKPLLRLRTARKKAKSYDGETIGQVVGDGVDTKRDAMIEIINALPAENLDDVEYEIYNPIVRYEVDGVEYEVESEYYSKVRPIHGRKAKVLYKTDNPRQAYVLTEQKYKKPLKIVRKDEQYFYCASGLRRNIKIPVGEVPERAVPGQFLVEKYGFYYVEKPCEQARSLMEKMDTGNFDDYKNY